MKRSGIAPEFALYVLPYTRDLPDILFTRLTPTSSSKALDLLYTPSLLLMTLGVRCPEQTCMLYQAITVHPVDTNFLRRVPLRISHACRIKSLLKSTESKRVSGMHESRPSSLSVRYEYSSRFARRNLYTLFSAPQSSVSWIRPTCSTCRTVNLHSYMLILA